MDSEKQKLVSEFVERMRAAAGNNLLSVILYGSAAAGDYVPDHSDVNLLCVLGDTSFASIQALAPAVGWWDKKKHRAQLEYELREKTILLRQRLLMVSAGSNNDDAKWDLLLHSLPAFGTLFRHALIALGDAGAGSGSKREVAVAVAGKLGIDASVFGELLDIREHKKDRKAAKVDEMFARYLKLVEQVTGAVDKM